MRIVIFLFLIIGYVSITFAQCDCPYDRDKNGNLCGGKSAWSLPGGKAPYCDPSLIAQWKNSSSSNSFVKEAGNGESISESEYLNSKGPCPCPYNRDKAGNLCGARSAWSKSGGYAPKCDPALILKYHKGEMSSKSSSQHIVCLCPLDTDAHGNICGRKSAYSMAEKSEIFRFISMCYP